MVQAGYCFDRFVVASLVIHDIYFYRECSLTEYCRWVADLAMVGVGHCDVDLELVCVFFAGAGSGVFGKPAVKNLV